MKIGVMGTGMVGLALATKLVGLGHQVMMGARERDNEKASVWAEAQNGQTGSFADVAQFSDIVFFATLGSATLDVAKAAGPEALAEKVVVDVTNPLDMSAGFPPPLLPGLSNTTSLGEALQSALPKSRVVKALNTMNCELMVDPSRVPGRHDVFLCGEDADAKSQVIDLLTSFGWEAPIDMGGIDAARGLEGLMLFWLKMYAAVGHLNFNYHVVMADA